MSTLTTKERNALPDSAFALPGRRYPIVDKDHAVAAKARAEQSRKLGRLTQAEYDLVIKRADHVLSEK